jgi:hypothetical protein
MKDVRPLVRVQHGSHLYGTSTPASDLDFKSVHIPSGRAIIMQRAENVIDRQVKVSSSIKNTAADIDDQSYSLQKFLKMISDGDTVATEILFAPDPLFIDSDWIDIQAIGKSLLNRQCKGFVGYCRRQAAKYGIKGSRMAACEDIITTLTNAVDKYGTTAPLEKITTDLHLFCALHEFSAIDIIPSQAGTNIPHLEVVDRKVPFTASLKTALDIYQKVYDNYGDRARAAKTDEGIDWKAVSHAVRVARQAIELLSTKNITFPRPDAAELLEIKKGLIPYSTVSEQLEMLVEEVETISTFSALPETSDTKLIERTIFKYYVEATWP